MSHEQCDTGGLQKDLTVDQIKDITEQTPVSEVYNPGLYPSASTVHYNVYYNNIDLEVFMGEGSYQSHKKPRE